ncbi:MAG: alpha-amylase family glycosyl hydrolase [Paludibacteraceae bacterium]|nr:alpha-amylase family glycosyl hydrolase [Paludibacteraceae bacterium]
MTHDNKMNIYQVLPRLFGNENTTNKPHGTLEENGCGKLNDFTPKALQAIKKLGITHVWYTGVIEHATQTDYSTLGIALDHKSIVKGIAGSPYAIKDYYDIDPDLAVDVNNRMKEFEAMIERTHKAELKVIIDFVPNHVARQYKSDAKPGKTKDLGQGDRTDWNFSQQNNFYYISNEAFNPQFDVDGYEEFPAKVTGNDQFTASPSITDWYETVKLNYGVDYMGGREKYFDPVPDTWTKMRDILLFWAKKKVDGFRCDMAEMVPVEFWGWAIQQVKEKFPHVIFIAEVYNPDEYRNYIYNGKFDFLYDKVGLYDTLRAVTQGQASVGSITNCWQAVNDIQTHMLNFLENHDEQRVASDFFAGKPENALPAVIISATLSNSPFMTYSGQELGERGMDTEGFSGLDGRTSIFDYWSVNSIRNWHNNGKLNQEKLTADQQQLQSFYQKLLTLRLKEKALSEGTFYDLMWVNYENPNFNPEKQYTFFRQCENDLLLIVVNFDDQDVTLGIHIPLHALDFLNLPAEKAVKCVDLLSGEKTTGILSAQKLFNVGIKRKNGVILKIK